MNLLSDLSDQNYFQYKFSVKGLAVFSCKIPKAGCGLQGPYFLRGPVSAKPMIMKVPVHLLLPLVKIKNKKNNHIYHLLLEFKKENALTRRDKNCDNF